MFRYCMTMVVMLLATGRGFAQVSTWELTPPFGRALFRSSPDDCHGARRISQSDGHNPNG